MDGTAYLLTIHNVEARDITCTCASHLNRGIRKHMGAILVRLDLEAEMELAPAAATEDRERIEAPHSANGTVSQED